MRKSNLGFTIIELLVVIVIIGVLASVTFVAYGGIQAKVIDESVTADVLRMGSTQLKYKMNTGISGKAYYSGSATDTSGLGFKPNNGNVIDVVVNSSGYCIRGYNLKGTKNSIINASVEESVAGTCTLGETNYIPPSAAADGITIGSQVWSKYNLNVGTMITGVTTQTNNATLEKYCYNNLESNCIAYGALYQWDEAMQYVTTERAQGICPTGSHIPSDNDWKILEMQLGMKQESFDDTGWHSLDQATTATQFKAGGSTGLNLPLSGYNYNYSFYDRGTYGNYWASSESSTSAWTRYININYVYDGRSADPKTIGYSVRCLGN